MNLNRFDIWMQLLKPHSREEKKRLLMELHSCDDIDPFLVSVLFEELGLENV